jgi:hypothetical protein
MPQVEVGDTLLGSILRYLCKRKARVVRKVVHLLDSTRSLIFCRSSIQKFEGATEWHIISAKQ